MKMTAEVCGIILEAGVESVLDGLLRLHDGDGVVCKYKAVIINDFLGLQKGFRVTILDEAEEIEWLPSSMSRGKIHKRETIATKIEMQLHIEVFSLGTRVFLKVSVKIMATIKTIVITRQIEPKWQLITAQQILIVFPFFLKLTAAKR